VNRAPPIPWVGQETNTMSVNGVLLFTKPPVPGTNNFWRVRSVPLVVETACNLSRASSAVRA